MPHFISIFFFLMVPTSYGADSCQQIFAQPVEPLFIERNQIRPLVFTNTEVLRRNNDIGQQQLGEIRLEKWFELSPFDQGYYNFVGLTADGKAYHVIDWNGERRMARLLSGEKSFAELYLVNGKILLAVDAHGKVSIYSPKIWRTSPLRTLIKRTLQLQSGLFLLSTSLFYYLSPQTFEPQFLPLVLGMTGTLSAMQGGFLALFKFEKLNTFPDGFSETLWRIENEQSFENLSADIMHLLQQSPSIESDMLPMNQATVPRPHAEATEDIR